MLMCQSNSSSLTASSSVISGQKMSHTIAASRKSLINEQISMWLLMLITLSASCSLTTTYTFAPVSTLQTWDLSIWRKRSMHWSIRINHHPHDDPMTRSNLGIKHQWHMPQILNSLRICVIILLIPWIIHGHINMNGNITVQQVQNYILGIWNVSVKIGF